MPARLSAPNAPAATDNTSPRADGRRPDQLRPIRFQNHIAPYASGSTLIEWGDTRVICGVTVEDTVPRWMKEQNVSGGWITAEYSMLPYSTPQRKQRDISKGKIDGRSQEIQRLGWTEQDLRGRRKGDQRKVNIARRLRQESTMSLKWIAQRLQMGSWTYVSNLLHGESPTTLQAQPQLPLLPLCK